MNANQSANKRAGIGVQARPKKAKGDDVKEMELDAPDKAEKAISVDPCSTLIDLSKLIPNIKATNGTNPYLSMFGEGQEAFHDDLQTITRHLGQLMFKSKILNSAQLQRIRQDQLATAEWILVMQRILSPQKEDSLVLSQEQLTTSRLILSRLAHTPPKNLFDNIRFEKTPPTLQARI